MSLLVVVAVVLLLLLLLLLVVLSVVAGGGGVVVAFAVVGVVIGAVDVRCSSCRTRSTFPTASGGQPSYEGAT